VIGSGADLVLDHSDASLFQELLNTWAAKRPRNVLRSVYYEGKNALKDFGISIPPQMRMVDTALGWVAKGVRGLTDRSVFEDFVSAAGADDPFDLAGIMADNNFLVEFPQAQVSSAIHACSFLTVSNGDVTAGEPEVLVLARAADDSAALWDRRRRAVRGFLSVIDVDESDTPTSLVMYTPEKVITLRKSGSKWSASVQRNPLGEVSVAPLVYKPELKRPFGHSRVTRSAMSITDSALRTILRSEVSAEFYSAPEYWLFGAESSAFEGKDKWSAVMGRIKAISKDEDGDLPQVQRFAGSTPQPHTDQLRMWATLFAGDQGLSVSSLGVVQDNPSSAEAIYAAKEDLITDARQANVSWGHGAVKAMQLAVRLRDGVDVLPDELRRLHAMFTDPAMVSPTAAADAFSKRAAAIPGFAESEVGLESAGLTREQIIRFQADQKRAQAGDRLTQLVAAARQVSGQAVTDGNSDADSGVPGAVPVAGGAGAA
jgi:hypothetical protein